MDDLCVRFIVNLPQEELVSVERICFQVEEAQWFYEDFIRPLDPRLPSLSLKEFSMRIFAHCPLMSAWSSYHHAAAFSEFMAYKTRVPVRGAILLNDRMDHCVLVKGYKKNANWSFPRGKINKDEPDLDCAVREVYEETGLDVRQAGLLAPSTPDDFIEIPLREQNMRLYVIRCACACDCWGGRADPVAVRAASPLLSGATMAADDEVMTAPEGYGDCWPPGET
ncbi:mRNA-decapping enzyme subunit 2 [Ascosphaera acerosa]|nr:mRNA-decapping enzyme subunit 2 [Ascosphaera acerosa]